MGGVTAYPDQMTPGPSGLQQAGFDVAQGLTPIAAGGQQYFGDMLAGADPSAPGRAMGMAETGLQNMMQPFDPSTVTEGMQPARQLAMDTFGDISKALRERSVAGAGTADTGGLDRALAREGGRLSLGLGAQAYPYMFQGQQNQLGRQQQAIGQAQNQAQLPGQVLGQAEGMGMNTLSQALNIGSQQRGITGEQMGEEAGKWQFEQPWANPYINALNTLQGGAPLQSYGVEQQGPGMLSQMAPALMGLMGKQGGISNLAGNIGGIGSMLFGAPAASSYGVTGGLIGPATQGGAMAAGGGLLGGMGSAIGSGIGYLGSLFSDERVKENIKPIDNALSKVERLAGHTYNYKFNSPDNRNGGIMAQDLEEVLPDAVSEINGVKFVRYDAVVGLLVNAVNELDKRTRTS